MAYYFQGRTVSFGECTIQYQPPNFVHVQKKYPSFHNHGSVKNGCISNSSYLLNTAIFHFHDYGRKCKEQPNLQKIKKNTCPNFDDVRWFFGFRRLFPHFAKTNCQEKNNKTTTQLHPEKPPYHLFLPFFCWKKKTWPPPRISRQLVVVAMVFLLELMAPRRSWKSNVRRPKGPGKQRDFPRRTSPWFRWVVRSTRKYPMFERDIFCCLSDLFQ